VRLPDLKFAAANSTGYSVSAKRPVGRRGLEATLASLGGGGLGNFFRSITNAEAEGLLNAVWSAGVRYYDTAPFYGRGLSERRLGAFLRERPRQEFVLSTKVGRLLTPAPEGVEEDGIFFDPSPFNSRYDYSYDGVMRSHEASLQRLGLSRIDVLLVHDIGPMLHGADADNQLRILKTGGLRALEELRSRGDIQAYGLGVNEIDVCLDCLDYGDPDAFLLAGRFTLLEQQAAKPLLARCRERGVSLLIGGVFNSGILATGAIPGARYNYQAASPQMQDKVRLIEAVCARHSVTIGAAALQFPLTNPAVATVLLGVGTKTSFQRNVDAMSAAIPVAFWRELVAEGLLDPELSPL
jgi:D-threo-aldose 1-dehydrogenase